MSRRIIGVGETVLDIIFKNDLPQAAKAGGSALNSMISLGRIGLETYFISELGSDPVGDMILRFLKDNGIQTKFINTFKTGKSAVSLAFLNKENDANYHFYKDYPNQRLEGELPEFTEHDIILFGSFYGLNKNLRPGIKKILNKATDAGAIILYDPNFRASHLDELDELLPIIMENIEYSDITRGSDEDFFNIFNLNDSHKIWKTVNNKCNNLLITKNKNGTDIFTENFNLSFDVEEIKPLSTIGAGDNFNAGIIFGLIKHNITKKSLNKVSKSTWSNIIIEANNLSQNVCLSYDNYISKEMANKLKTENL